ncbi:hypothetical protein EZJ49_03180 [Bdellovibrio bacteriovorus]|uniref:hypothetical protein n=1 Tax=Bdellovibrio bacteriovorus TaxID=959 RepID=UPI0021D2CD14|nr:hypothetical protein [Bdellovibrio bacteriovorus]UXR65252.1 hypothetical protein EZJ49_03180 [Bdellovibrio bacteriovorus]
MKNILLAALLSVAFVAPAFANVGSGDQNVISAKKGKGKSEPAPKDGEERGEEKDPREETYEGNDRGGGSFDGGGYGGGGFDGGGYGGGDGGGGGMIGEIFSVAGKGKTYPVTSNTTVEDRGEILVYTTRTQEDISYDETCTTITVLTVAKSTGKVISSESNEYCNRWPM